ncbi:hypothetical protein CDL12_06069 [Handroanthus impetiginosus]|uniref:DOG1 domain-containing protein n=1 Tax=Handroanthus impetiginosus TaxID=429701 RepID=A0A2G9HUT5_9LAMI|nr:hypothetical protein CDL12_06069 [Handroanthus impetiginosus]
MSVASSSATFMARALHTGGNQDNETFHKFFECWIVEQSQHLEELVSATKDCDQEQLDGRNGRIVTQSELDERILRPKITQVIEHYEQYYRAKSRWAWNNVLSMFNPSWRSSLEDAFLWIGGWRPSMAFHLFYSKSGLQLEAKLAEIIRGLSTGDLGDLTPTQLGQVNELQKVTIREEKEISEKLAKQQETVADSTMVELSHAVTEAMRESGDDIATAADDGRVEASLATKEEGLAEVLRRADDLRLKTLKEVVSVLTPAQGVHFLIAAAELHLRIHEWGRKKDATRHQNHRGVGGGSQ